MAKRDKSSDTKNGENGNGDNSEYENFQQLLKQVLSVPKGEVDEKREEHEREKERKRMG